VATINTNTYAVGSEIIVEKLPARQQLATASSNVIIDPGHSRPRPDLSSASAR